MAIELNITDADIEEIVKHQLITSGIGEHIKEGVRKVLNGYDSPIEAELKKYVTEIAKELIREKYDNQIKEMVTEYINQKVTNEILQSTVDKFTNKMIRAAEDKYY